MAPMTGVVDDDWSPDIASSPTDLAGKSLLVVGGTSGLGQAIAVKAAKQGAAVTVVGRSFKDDPNEIKFIKADLSLMKEAKRIGETIENAYAFDVVLLTTGILAGPEREVSEEGIEMDMAVSYLSRLVILKHLVPRLKKDKCRVFIMGFPGSNQTNIKPDDLNSEKSYEGALGFVHTNTVAGNECLVLDYASKSDTILFFGLNPGLIKTGIRDNLYKSGVMKYVGPVVEWMLGLVSTSPDGYAANMVPLLFCPTLDDHNGAMFNPKAQPVKPSEQFTEDPELISKFVQGGEKLVKEKAGV